MTGSGTESDPYQISTADQLKLFRDIVNGAGGQTPNRGAWAVLTADIDLNNEPWTPIGPDRDSAYTGTFDGQGHTVKNLSVTVNVQPGRAGLFGCVKDGTIRKLTVEARCHVLLTRGGVAALRATLTTKPLKTAPASARSPAQAKMPESVELSDWSTIIVVR